MGGARRLPRGEFTALWSAEALSVAGDQLAKVALSIVAYERTGSAAIGGATYALTLLPPLVAGPTLSPLADRFPRREVMAVCCVAQAGLVAVMAVPQVPVVVLAIAIALVSALAAPFKAAQSAVVVDVLGRELHKAGRARLTVIRESGQLAGLAGAATVVATVGPTVAFLLDAVSFLAAAVLVAAGLRARPAARHDAAGDSSSGRTAWRLLLDDRPVRLLGTLVLLIGLTAVPDGVIAVLVEQTGAPSWTVGPLLAADCVGIIVGARFVETRSPAQQRALIAPLAVLALAPLAVFALRPGPVGMALLLAASGLGSAYLALAVGEITERVPSARAGSVNGLLGAGLRAGQGLAVLAGGLLAQHVKSAAMAVSVSGLVGVALTGWVACLWHRTLPPRQHVRSA